MGRATRGTSCPSNEGQGTSPEEASHGALGEPRQNVRGLETGLGENGSFPCRRTYLGWSAKGLAGRAEARGPGGEEHTQSTE